MRKIVVIVTKTFEYDSDMFDFEDDVVDESQVHEKVLYDLREIVEDEDVSSLDIEIMDEDIDDEF
jgi:hypothetical protein